MELLAPSAKNQFENENHDNVPEIATYISYPTDYHIFDTKWLPSCPTKFVSVGATSKSSASRGCIQIAQLNSDRLESIKSIEKKSPYRCATFGATVRSTSSLALGNFHGGLQIFDAERFDFPVFEAKAHSGVVNCLDGLGSGGGAEIVTGGRDGSIKVWDPRQGGPVFVVSPVKKEDGGSGCRDCWTVCFIEGEGQHDRTVFAGFDNGDVKAVDLRTVKERWSYNVGSGICKLSSNKKCSKANRLAAGTVDGSIYLLGLGQSTIPDHVKVAEASSIWSINYLPHQDNTFASVGESIEIWRHW